MMGCSALWRVILSIFVSVQSSIYHTYDLCTLLNARGDHEPSPIWCVSFSHARCGVPPAAPASALCTSMTAYMQSLSNGHAQAMSPPNITELAELRSSSSPRLLPVELRTTSAFASCHDVVLFPPWVSYLTCSEASSNVSVAEAAGTRKRPSNTSNHSGLLVNLRTYMFPQVSRTSPKLSNPHPYTLHSRTRSMAGHHTRRSRITRSKSIRNTRSTRSMGTRATAGRARRTPLDIQPRLRRLPRLRALGPPVARYVLSSPNSTSPTSPWFASTFSSIHPLSSSRCCIGPEPSEPAQ
ncbi:hypothetical protein C8Q80DRAFT_864092 [Daedaleopsis nitida]|nr:hypothetical protein C8Q80DRAFT_864092 [Daedaleopsis nitida]